MGVLFSLRCINYPRGVSGNEFKNLYSKKSHSAKMSQSPISFFNAMPNTLAFYPKPKNCWQPIRIEIEKNLIFCQPIRIEYYVTRDPTARVEVPSRLSARVSSTKSISIHKDLHPPHLISSLLNYFTIVEFILTSLASIFATVLTELEVTIVITGGFSRQPYHNATTISCWKDHSAIFCVHHLSEVFVFLS